jgi:hypothetical protein
MAPARLENARRITESQKQRENCTIAAEKSNLSSKSRVIRNRTPILPVDEETSDNDEEQLPPPPKPKQKVSIEDWTYQLVVAAYCDKKCIYSKVKLTKINQANIRIHGERKFSMDKRFCHSYAPWFGNV